MFEMLHYLLFIPSFTLSPTLYHSPDRIRNPSLTVVQQLPAPVETWGRLDAALMSAPVAGRAAGNLAFIHAWPMPNITLVLTAAFFLLFTTNLLTHFGNALLRLAATLDQLKHSLKREMDGAAEFGR